MGLDSVELVVAFEKYFQIDIPDREAENIRTVGEAAACVMQLKGLSSAPVRTAVYYTVLEKLLGCMQPDFPTTQATTLLSTFRHSQALAQLDTCLGLKVPQLPALQPPLSGWLQRLLNIGQPDPLNWSKYTVVDLTDWVVAQNYASLLPTPTTLYEVQRVTIGITSYCSGLLVPKIRLQDSFTNDLGID